MIIRTAQHQSCDRLAIIFLQKWMEKHLGFETTSSSSWNSRVSINDIASLGIPFWRYYELPTKSPRYCHSYCDAFIYYAATSCADLEYFTFSVKTLVALFRSKLRHKRYLNTLSIQIGECDDPALICRIIRLLSSLHYENTDFWGLVLPGIICKNEILCSATPESLLTVMEAYIAIGKVSRNVFFYLETLILEKLCSSDFSIQRDEMDLSKKRAIFKTLKNYMNRFG